MAWWIREIKLEFDFYALVFFALCIVFGKAIVYQAKEKSRLSKKNSNFSR